MAKYIIETIGGYSTKKDGTPYLDKAGNPAKNIVMQINGERVSFFDTEGLARGWKAGTEIDGEIVEKNEWKNFYPSETQYADPILIEINQKLDFLIATLTGKEEVKTTWLPKKKENAPIDPAKEDTEDFVD